MFFCFCFQIIKAWNPCSGNLIKLSFHWVNHKSSWLPYWSCTTFVAGHLQYFLFCSLHIHCLSVFGSQIPYERTMPFREWSDKIAKCCCLLLLFLFVLLLFFVYTSVVIRRFAVFIVGINFHFFLHLDNVIVPRNISVSFHFICCRTSYHKCLL